MKGEYRIVRFYFEDRKPPQVLKEGVTLKEAQAHCDRPSTMTADWYDGIQPMKKRKKAVRS